MDKAESNRTLRTDLALFRQIEPHREAPLIFILSSPDQRLLGQGSAHLQGAEMF
jgi:hypothetical protein